MIAEGIASDGPTTRVSRFVSLRKAALDVLLIVLPWVFLATMVASLVTIGLHKNAAYDLRVAFLPAAHAVIHGSSPYANPADPILAHQAAYVYPPFVGFLTAPMLLMPAQVAAIVGVLISLLTIPVLLYVAGVRDPRCYGLAACWGATWNAIQNVNVSLPIACALVLAWRLRNSQRASGLLLGCCLAAKVFVWPLLVWPLAMARRRALVSGVVTGVALIFGSWAVIGFAGLSSYRKLLSVLTGYEEKDSYSVSGALRVLGVGVGPARAAAIVLTLALLALCVVYGRRRDDQRAFAAAILAALASTPILWQHYLMLLLVALAVCRPRLSLAWFLPVLGYISPFTGNGDTAQALLVPIVASLVGTACLTRPGYLRELSRYPPRRERQLGRAVLVPARPDS